MARIPPEQRPEPVPDGPEPSGESTGQDGRRGRRRRRIVIAAAVGVAAVLAVGAVVTPGLVADRSEDPRRTSQEVCTTQLLAELESPSTARLGEVQTFDREEYDADFLDQVKAQYGLSSESELPADVEDLLLAARGDGVARSEEGEFDLFVVGSVESQERAGQVLRRDWTCTATWTDGSPPDGPRVSLRLGDAEAATPRS